MLNGPMAGALFENYCIQETIKLFFHEGRRANIYFIRTNNNLEVDLLIEESFQTLIPVEIKLNKTPSLAMGSNISRFRKLFDRFDIKKGMIVSLTEESVPFSKDLVSLTMDDYLDQI